MNMKTLKKLRPGAVAALCVFLIANIITGSAFGSGVFDLMRIDPTPRGSALGGHPVALSWYGGLDAIFNNPAGLASNSTQKTSIAYGDHPIDLSSGMAAYGRPLLQGYGSVAISHFNYGSFDEYASLDAARNGTFTANEIMLIAGYGKTIVKGLSAGAAGKFVSGKIESYKSSAVAFDAGLYFETGISDIDLAATVSNIGTQISAYNEVSEDIPMTIRAGGSKKLEHLPLRLSAASHLEQNEDVYLTASGEFTVSPILKLRVGYTSFGIDYRVEGASDSFAGISGGLGINWQRMNFDYAFQSMGAIGQVHRLGFAMAI
ncbi:MAG: PorV/PorQ family protein [Candidatus Electryonea clarkiae]|nr:PorV/PorQ family protein [Candidatus Electryonea clarkiae]MDP8286455.1 PorV/PorQ family protein [Candidatus Electryonea clarkiae]